ncbi:MAG TPA: hypothetical protein VKG26_10460, partial [Bacteroidia bacterium]|nr:hypothetical protein [Bacteroidia bacterium]
MSKSKTRHYRATKRINKDALLEFLKKETSQNKEVMIKLYEVGGIVYVLTSHSNLLEKVDELYPNIFKSSEPPPYEGNL